MGLFGGHGEMVGIDIGRDRLKLVLMRGTAVVRSVSADLPDNMVEQGQVKSPMLMGTLIRDTLRENGMKAKSAALVLQDDTSIIRNVTVPQMTEEQLKYNLPYEFRDYITGEMRDYAFDYEVVSSQGEPGEAGATVTLMAVGMRRKVLEDAQEMIHTAGLKLEKAAPAICGYETLLERAGKTEVDSCIMDIGYTSSRMMFFNNAHYSMTHMLEFGIARAVEAVADEYNIDIHLAQTYLTTNFEDCQSSTACRNAFKDISVEVIKAMNYYEFNNAGGQLSDVWISGGGSTYEGLKSIIDMRLPQRVGTIDALDEDYTDAENFAVFAPAIGLVLS